MSARSRPSGCRSTTRSAASSPRTSRVPSTSLPGPTPPWTATRRAPTTCAAHRSAAPVRLRVVEEIPAGTLPRADRRAGRVRPHLHRRAAAGGHRRRGTAGGHRRGQGRCQHLQGPRRRREPPPRGRGRAARRRRAAAGRRCSARRNSASSPRSRWPIRWCIAGRGSPSWAAATRSSMSTSPRRS